MLYLQHKIYIIHYYLNKYFPRQCYNLVLTAEWLLRTMRLRKSKRLVLIYGEPRSGTSFITGLIHKMGFYAGPYVWLLNANQSNPDGYFECVPFQNNLDKFIGNSEFNFENNLPEASLNLPKEVKLKIKSIVDNGNIELLKYNKFSLFADSISEVFPEALWIHVYRDPEAVYTSNNKFIGGRNRDSFFKAYNKRLGLWKHSNISKRAIEINYSELVQQEDVLRLVIKLQSILSISLTDEQVNDCVSLFRPKYVN